MMKLTPEQQAILDGAQGETMAKVMKTQVMYGEAFGAEKMVPVTSEYNHLVTSFGLKLLAPVYELMDKLLEADAASKQKFSVDPRPVDPNVPANFLQKLIFDKFMYSKQDFYELQDQCKVVELKEAVWNGSAFEKDGSTYAYFYSSSWLAEQPELVKGATYTVIGWLNWYNNPQISPLQAPELVAEAPAHEHTECPECGKCTAEDCDGTEADKCAGHEEEPEQPEQPEVEGSVKYTFADLTGKGTELTASSALSIFGTENGLTSVTVTKVYNGNGDGGAYPQTAGFLKFGTSKANGVLTLNFAEGTKVTKVVINCHDWYKKSASYPTNSNKVSVNGSTAVLAPYTEDGTPGDLTFELEATNKVEITSALRVFVFSITVYFGE